MEQMKMMKEQLISLVQGQLSHPDCVDAKELGEVVDMIKDLSEACYYCSITEAMADSEKDSYKNMEPMYYGGNHGGQNSGNSSRYYTPSRRMNPVYYTPDMYREKEWDMGMDMHDPREGRAMVSRRMYMESKEMHKDSESQMRDLEKYIQDLGEDITEMIQNATPEEKQVLQQKIATLSTKIR